MFCSNFAIPRLQNETMEHLILLLIQSKPHLLNRNNVVSICKYAPSSELKWLAAYTVVAQIEEGSGADLKAKVQHFKDEENVDAEFAVSQTALHHSGPLLTMYYRPSS